MNRNKARLHFPSRRRVLNLGWGLIVGGTAGVLSSRSALAQYPERPVRVVVPQPAAGPTDIIARMVAAELATALGGTVFVENKPGAGGNIGIGAAARSEPDGYTLMVISSVFAVNPALYAKVPYDPLNDFVPVCEMAVAPNCLVVDPKLGVSSVSDLVNLARKEPGKLNYATPGIGTNPQLAAEMLKLEERIDMVHVPHQGGGPALQAILSGTVPILFTGLPPAHPYIKSGQLKALAMMAPNRWHDLPDVPTWSEVGYKGPTFETFQSLMAPVGTPSDIVARLEKETLAILAKAEMKERLLKAGYEVTARPGTALQQRIAQEVPLWKDMVARAGIRVN